MPVQQRALIPFHFAVIKYKLHEAIFRLTCEIVLCNQNNKKKVTKNQKTFGLTKFRRCIIIGF